MSACLFDLSHSLVNFRDTCTRFGGAKGILHCGCQVSHVLHVAYWLRISIPLRGVFLHGGFPPALHCSLKHGPVIYGWRAICGLYAKMDVLMV